MEKINYPIQISQIFFTSMIGMISSQRIRGGKKHVIYFQAPTSVLHGYIIHMKVVTDLAWS